MSVRVVTPPASFVSVADAKKHLLVDHGDDDLLIEGYIAAACAWIDGPQGWLGRAIGQQTLEARGWWGCLENRLPYPPIIDLVSVDVEDDAAVTTAVDPHTYRLRDDGVFVVDAGSVLGWQKTHIIRYQAGFSTVPAPIVIAVKMLVAQWYGTREPVRIGASVEHLPFAVEALLAPWRVYS